ncbi:hypothetical protein [uncultured Ellagibacter sp.]|uniref:hypothetical protein n=1 Tax=uncultured Ellagibacter sp. TaxID=2137580 RepID=UPI00260C9416|nr:hypothetical protein [uncultured Ellagibacter sp.]
MKVQPFVSLGKLLGEIERYIPAFPLQLNIELFVRVAVASIGRVNVEVRTLRNERSSRYRSRFVSSAKLKDFILWFRQTTRVDLNIGRWLTISQKESEGEIDDLLDIGLHLAGGLLSTPEYTASEQKSNYGQCANSDTHDFLLVSCRKAI